MFEYLVITFFLIFYIYYTYKTIVLHIHNFVKNVYRVFDSVRIMLYLEYKQLFVYFI